jgi:transcription-repair coupling factor (superfamily II helicase)
MGDILMLDALRDETIDRFGPIPRSLGFLFDVSRVRIVGADFGISKILCGTDETAVHCAPDSPLFKIKPPKGWFRHAQGFLGPGGLYSLGHFVSHIIS